jgi:hypothetical protein
MRARELVSEILSKWREAKCDRNVSRRRRLSCLEAWPSKSAGGMARVFRGLPQFVNIILAFSGKRVEVVLCRVFVVCLLRRNPVAPDSSQSGSVLLVSYCELKLQNELFSTLINPEAKTQAPPRNNRYRKNRSLRRIVEGATASCDHYQYRDIACGPLTNATRALPNTNTSNASGIQRICELYWQLP